MKRTGQEKRQEILFYVFLWGAIFALVPAILAFRGAAEHIPFRMRDMLSIWGGILPFLVLFLLHDLLAVPLLLDRKKPGAYIAVAVVLVAAFGGYVWLTRLDPDPIGGPRGERPPGWVGQGGPRELMAPPDGGPMLPLEAQPEPPRGLPWAPEFMKVILGTMVIALNLGVKYYFKAAGSEQRMQALKTENLGRQLEALRYQINPHFFMNTLNNIHALVDIDPEKAKESIEEFSKLMRYVLYEGNRPTIPLDRELDFLQHYVALMRMRYADTVRIDLNLPSQAGTAEIPPLVLASFVENAFKHGISYERPSFVRITLAQEGNKIVFKCVNSRQGAEQVRSHGIGLQNVRERLDLLYGDRYTLHIEPGAEVYDVLLLLPLSAGLKEEGA